MHHRPHRLAAQVASEPRDAAVDPPADVPFLVQPVDADFLLQRFELPIARQELGILLLRQCRSERVRKADPKPGFEIGGQIGEGTGGGVKLDGQPLQDLETRLPCFESVLLQDGVLDLGIVHVGHVQRTVLLPGGHQQVLDDVGPGFIAEVGNQRKAVEDLTGHGVPPARAPVFGVLPIRLRAACFPFCAG